MITIISRRQRSTLSTLSCRLMQLMRSVEI